MNDLTFKIDQNGKLICVDEKHERFTYLFPKHGDPDLQWKNLKEVAEYLRDRLESPGWTYY